MRKGAHAKSPERGRTCGKISPGATVLWSAPGESGCGAEQRPAPLLSPQRTFFGASADPERALQRRMRVTPQRVLAGLQRERPLDGSLERDTGLPVHAG